jgi:putative transposase
MARQSRLFIPECPLILQLQGIAGQEVFRTREAFELFRNQLPISAAQEAIDLHAFCLVPSGVMLMVSALKAPSVGRFVQNLNRYFSSVIRQIYQTHPGSSWEPRFKSTVVQPGIYSLKACLYVEQFAVRAAGVHDLFCYPWSSFSIHTGAVNEPLLVDLPSYWQLGNTPFERQSRYRQFGEQGLDTVDNQELTNCLKKGWLWGDNLYCSDIQSVANRSVRPRPRGRPVKYPNS